MEEYEDLPIIMNDNIIYGSSPIPDCPANFNDGDYCVLLDKHGAYPLTGAGKGKTQGHITGISAIPVYKIKEDAIWGVRGVWNRNKFINFQRKTPEGMTRTLIKLPQHQPDYTPIQEFYNNEFVNVDWNAFAQLDPPNEGWANIKDCGNFPCTAPYNVIYRFRGSKWSGVKPSKAKENFEVVSNNPGFTQHAERCEFVKDWNAYFCQNDKLGLLHFESQEDERFDRQLAPVYVAKQGTQINNKLNSFMDHIWDGFYSGQQKMPRFPSLVEIDRGSIHDITFTGNAPKKAMFSLFHEKANAGTTVRIAYPDAVSIQVKVNDKKIEMNEWDKSINQYGEVKQRFCGENRYIGVQNILEFYVTAGCKVHIMPRNAIQTQVRMEWTIEDFYSKGGTTALVDRISSVLGIHASQIKVVSVYEGSLVLDYEINASEEDEESGTTTDALAEVKAKQTEAFATGGIDLGAPILDVAVVVATTDTSAAASESTSSNTVEKVISDGVVTAAGYDPITITVTETNAAQRQEWNPDVDITEDADTVYQDMVIKKEVYKDPSVNTINKLDEEGNSGSMAIAVVVGVILAILLIVGIRICYLKANSDKLFATKIAEKKKSMEEMEMEDNVIRIKTKNANLCETNKKLCMDDPSINECEV